MLLWYRGVNSGWIQSFNPRGTDFERMWTCDNGPSWKRVYLTFICQPQTENNSPPSAKKGHSTFKNFYAKIFYKEYISYDEYKRGRLKDTQCDSKQISRVLFLLLEHYSNWRLMILLQVKLKRYIFFEEGESSCFLTYSFWSGTP